MTLTYTPEQRARYERPTTIDETDAAQIADAAWIMINERVQIDMDASMPGDDRAENLVMEIFNAIMNAVETE